VVHVLLAEFGKALALEELALHLVYESAAGEFVDNHLRDLESSCKVHNDLYLIVIYIVHDANIRLYFYIASDIFKKCKKLKFPSSHPAGNEEAGAKTIKIAPKKAKIGLTGAI
jgi:hypothetical protein